MGGERNAAEDEDEKKSKDEEKEEKTTEMRRWTNMEGQEDGE